MLIHSIRTALSSHVAQRQGSSCMRLTTFLLSRSRWKGPHVVPFSQNIAEAIEKKTTIPTQARSCTIIPQFVGARFAVHNGKNYVPIEVTEQMVGHKLGEFAPTRKRFLYKQTKNK